MFSEKTTNRIKKLKGKIIYSKYDIVDSKGIIVDNHIGILIGQIKDIDQNGICSIYNPILNKSSQMSIVELNKGLRNNKFCLLKKFL